MGSPECLLAAAAVLAARHPRDAPGARLRCHGGAHAGGGDTAEVRHALMCISRAVICVPPCKRGSRRDGGPVGKSGSRYRKRT